MSFDFNSLYPNVMMTVNISPETKVGKVISNEEDTEVCIRKANGELLTLSKDKFEKILNEKCTMSANKVLYIKPSIKQGIVPAFLDHMYQQRVETKSLMKKNKKRVKAIDEEIKELEKQLAELE